VHREFKLAGHFYLKFCRGCAMQLVGSGATSGRDSGLCITITHRAIHRLLYSNSSPRKMFLSSPNHCTLYLAPSDFWLFRILKMILKVDVSQPWRPSNRMRWPNSLRFQKKKPSAVLSNNGRINGASVCVCVCVCSVCNTTLRSSSSPFRYLLQSLEISPG
jgi:hypothetical protein